MTIFDSLRADHDIQRALMRGLVETEGHSASRWRLFETLKMELAAHTTAEERHFYVPLMQHARTVEKARHSMTEHHTLDELIETLEETDMRPSAWLNSAKKL